MAVAVVGAALGAAHFGGVALTEQPQRGLDVPRLARDLALADRAGAPGGGHVSTRRVPVRPDSIGDMLCRDAEVDVKAFVEAGLGVGGERAPAASGVREGEPGQAEPLAVGRYLHRTD